MKSFMSLMVKCASCAILLGFGIIFGVLSLYITVSLISELKRSMRDDGREFTSAIIKAFDGGKSYVFLHDVFQDKWEYVCPTGTYMGIEEAVRQGMNLAGSPVKFTSVEVSGVDLELEDGEWGLIFLQVDKDRLRAKARMYDMHLGRDMFLSTADNGWRCYPRDKAKLVVMNVRDNRLYPYIQLTGE